MDFNNGATDFVVLFVYEIKKAFVCCICAKKNKYNFTKNNHKFQGSITERCNSLSKSSGMFWQNLLKVPVQRLNL